MNGEVPRPARKQGAAVRGPGRRGRDRRASSASCAWARRARRRTARCRRRRRRQDEFVTVTVKSDPLGAKVTRGDNDQTRHDAVGDQGQEGRRVVRRAREARRLQAADAQHQHRQELRGPGAAREGRGRAGASAGAAGGQHAAGGRTRRRRRPSTRRPRTSTTTTVVVSSASSKDKGESGAGDGKVDKPAAARTSRPASRRQGREATT